MSFILAEDDVGNERKRVRRMSAENRDYAFSELKTHWTEKEGFVDGAVEEKARRPFGRVDGNTTITSGGRRRSSFGGLAKKPPKLDASLMVGADALPSLGSPAAVKKQRGPHEETGPTARLDQDDDAAPLMRSPQRRRASVDSVALAAPPPNGASKEPSEEEGAAQLALQQGPVASSPTIILKAASPVVLVEPSAPRAPPPTPADAAAFAALVFNVQSETMDELKSRPPFAPPNSPEDATLLLAPPPAAVTTPRTMGDALISRLSVLSVASLLTRSPASATPGRNPPRSGGHSARLQGTTINFESPSSKLMLSPFSSSSSSSFSSSSSPSGAETTLTTTRGSPPGSVGDETATKTTMSPSGSTTSKDGMSFESSPPVALNKKKAGALLSSSSSSSSVTLTPPPPPASPASEAMEALRAANAACAAAVGEAAACRAREAALRRAEVDGAAGLAAERTRLETTLRVLGEQLVAAQRDRDASRVRLALEAAAAADQRLAATAAWTALRASSLQALDGEREARDAAVRTERTAVVEQAQVQFEAAKAEYRRVVKRLDAAAVERDGFKADHAREAQARAASDTLRAAAAKASADLEATNADLLKRIDAQAHLLDDANRARHAANDRADAAELKAAKLEKELADVRAISDELIAIAEAQEHKKPPSPTQQILSRGCRTPGAQLRALKLT